MAKKRKAEPRREWMAIVSFPHGAGMKPHVMMNDDMDEVATFANPEEIEELSMRHMLAAGVWHAFNFENGELEMIG